VRRTRGKWGFLAPVVNHIVTPISFTKSSSVLVRVPTSFPYLKQALFSMRTGKFCGLQRTTC
jgi:hypothetical protein